MILNDFIMLGRTEPQQTKKGITVCCAGYSKELREFVRVYPLPRNGIKRWSVCEVDLRRNHQDNRRESWRINSPDGTPLDREPEFIKVTGMACRDRELEYLWNSAAPSIKGLNEQRLSLGLIKPLAMRTWIGERQGLEDVAQLSLIQDLPEHERSRIVPQIEFSDADGWHKLSLLDWGCAEWMRKFPDKASQIWSNLHLNDPQYEHLLFVGNQRDRRNCWLIISVLSRKLETQTALSFQQDVIHQQAHSLPLWKP